MWDNKHKGKYRLDSPLTESGLDLWKQQIHSIVEEHGIPSRIVTSPFYRCRQMAEEFMILYRDVPVEVDPMCGEFLGHQKLRHVDNYMLRDDTLIYPIIYQEDLPQCRSRAHDVHNKYTEYNGFTLVITHGLLMYYISELFGNQKGFKEGEMLCIDY